MKKLIRMFLFLLTLLLVASPVHPAQQDVAPLAPAEAKDYFAYMEMEGVAIFLSKLPCPKDVADAGGLKPDPAIREKYSALRVIADNQFFKGCYRPEGPAYLIFLEDGERVAVPQDAFQPLEKPTH